MKTLRSFLFIFIFMPLFSAFSAGLSSAHAAEEFYTIQTGTYTPAAISYANRQFDNLAQWLKEKDLAGLRIIKTSKFYVVRLGRFAGVSEAFKTLEAVKPLVPDAFILKEAGTGDAGILKEFSKTAGKKTGRPNAEAATKPVARAGTAPPAGTDLKEAEAVEYYTVLAGEHPDKDKAAAQFEWLTKALLKKNLAYLRIEKDRNNFTVSLGKFDDFESARRFLKNLERLLPEAEIVRIKGGQGELVKLYDASASVPAPTGAKKAGEAQEGSRPSGVYVEMKSEKLEDFINNISSQYYEGNYEDAAALLKKGIEKWPDNADLYAWYGAALLNMKSPDKAYEIYNKAVELSPDVPDYHAGVGYSLLSIYMERAKASIEAFNKALQLDPDNVDALEGLGIVYVSIDKKGLAADIYNRLKELNPDAANRLNNMIINGVEWGK